ncbi:MAG TPA: hypothetical protein VH114_15145 [Candidatus Acidoferrum sp.]|nr:hypothetical protein [Candidatus Acidoferrum sp.]
MTSSSSPLLAAEQRAWQYWFSDGFTNLLIGVGNLLVAFCMLYTPHLPMALSVTTVLSVTAWLVALGLYAVVVLRQREIAEWLKAKITYPRTGYVRSPFPDEGVTQRALESLSILRTDATRSEEGQRLHSSRSKRMAVMMGLMLLASFGMMVIENRWVCTAAGVIMAVGLSCVRRDQRLSWIVLLGFPVIGLCISVFFASPVTGPNRLTYFLGGWGVLFAHDGAITLIRYIHQNPLAKAPEA